MCCHGDTITKDSSWLSVSVTEKANKRQKWTESGQTEAGSSSLVHLRTSSSSSALLLCAQFSALSPLADPHPKHSAAGLSCQCSPITTAPFPGLCICLDGGGFALGPRAGGNPFLLASLLNQTVCSLKWPITQIDWRLWGSCLPSICSVTRTAIK